MEQESFKANSPESNGALKDVIVTNVHAGDVNTDGKEVVGTLKDVIVTNVRDAGQAGNAAAAQGAGLATPHLSGDYNGDGMVDARDFHGTTTVNAGTLAAQGAAPGTPHLQGDFNNDGRVDSADYQGNTTIHEGTLSVQGAGHPGGGQGNNIIGVLVADHAAPPVGGPGANLQSQMQHENRQSLQGNFIGTDRAVGPHPAPANNLTVDTGAGDDQVNPQGLHANAGPLPFDRGYLSPGVAAPHGAAGMAAKGGGEVAMEGLHAAGGGGQGSTLIGAGDHGGLAAGGHGINADPTHVLDVGGHHPGDVPGHEGHDLHHGHDVPEHPVFPE